MMRVIQSNKNVENYVARYKMTQFLNQNLRDALQLFHFPVYENVYIEQAEQHYLYFLVEGQVQCNHYQVDGTLAVFGISAAFAVIGELEIFTEERVYSNVVAIRDTYMLGIPRPTVHRYGADDPNFLRFLFEQTRTKLYEANTRQKNRSLPVINQLAHFILDHRTDKQTAILPDKAVLAPLLGTSSRHLNRVFKQLMTAAIIGNSYPQIHILNQAELEKLAQ